MTGPLRWRLFGSNFSPYSIKVRSYLRFKGIEHDWVLRTAETMAEFDRHAKLPLLPLLISDDGEVLQDSTPMILALEARRPDPTIVPADPRTAFLSALIEEAADEWGNRLMAFYRWTDDRETTLRRVARMRIATGGKAEIDGEMTRIRRERLPKILEVAGISEANAPVFRASFAALAGALPGALGGVPFLFGHRPSLADFGLYAQVHQASLDDSARSALQSGDSGSVERWCRRMLDPKSAGEYDDFEVAATPLAPLLASFVGSGFLPWSLANARAVRSGAGVFRTDLHGMPFEAVAQRYSARTLSVVCRTYAPLAADPALRRDLQEAGCAEPLAEAVRMLGA